MNPLGFLLAAGAIALASSPAIANDMEFGGVVIPSQQTLSPATHDDIAFRPACSQLVPIQRAQTVFWTVTLSDGEQRVLATFPPMATEQAHLWLDSHGLCKIGGAAVPLVYTAQVPQRQVAQFTVTPDGGNPNPAGPATVTPVTPAADAMPRWAVGVGGVLLIGCAVGFVGLVRSRDHRQAAPRAESSQATTSAADVLADLFGGQKDA